MPAFMCAYLALGAEKILFATDYPFEKGKQAKGFVQRLPICDGDKNQDMPRKCRGPAETLNRFWLEISQRWSSNLNHMRLQKSSKEDANEGDYCAKPENRPITAHKVIDKSSIVGAEG